MWIQVRTIEDVSRKATIEELRERVWALFDVRPECQRLFYRGKQLENGYTLFDYDVGLNDIIHLLVHPDPDLPSTSKQTDVQTKPFNSPPKVKKTARVGVYKSAVYIGLHQLVLVSLILALDFIRYPESGTLEMNVKDLRPRARTTLKWNELNVGDVVMVSYNVENPAKRGFWYDAEITTLKAISRNEKELRVKIFLGEK